MVAIYLVHGTFVGTDSLGLLGHIGSLLPGAGSALTRMAKQLVDAVAGDVGNYTQRFADLISQGINPPGTRPIAVRRLHWSGQNHHIARADAAVRLIDELAQQRYERGSRVLLWGHSHAGNVFALVSHLLGCGRAVRDDFFQAARTFYRWPFTGKCDAPVWARVEWLLRDESLPIGEARLDFATFGTPIRYGWETAGFERLVHFICHRPTPGLPPYRTKFPPALEDVLAARDGDYVQQLGIAGTNISPGILSLRTWLADRRLGRLLEQELQPGRLLDRWECGRRAPDVGTTLLVDYPREGEGLLKHLAGHGLYTRLDWLLFHAEKTAETLYGYRW